ncbi:MAG: hypothetical protein WKF73_07820 [Nocardioidaceae bacterium]
MPRVDGVDLGDVVGAALTPAIVPSPPSTTVTTCTEASGARRGHPRARRCRQRPLEGVERDDLHRGFIVRAAAPRRNPTARG